jgi:hypothetical protein
VTAHDRLKKTHVTDVFNMNFLLKIDLQEDDIQEFIYIYKAFKIVTYRPPRSMINIHDVAHCIGTNSIIAFSFVVASFIY